MFLKWLISAMYSPMMMAPEGGEGGGGAPAGGAGGAAAAAAALAAPPAGGGGSPPNDGTPPVVDIPADAYYAKFENPEVKAWTHSLAKSHPTPEALALKAWNQEKLIGAGKDALIVPKKEAKPEEWKAFWAKVGAPEKADGYKMPATIKPEVAAELGKDELFTKFRDKAHAAGMPQQHFESVVDWYVNETLAAEEKQYAEFERKATEEFDGLKTDWGADYDKTMELSKRAVRAFLPYDKAKGAEAIQEVTNRLMGALGVKQTYHMFANIGKALVEDDFVLGGGNGGTNEQTPGSAKAEIAQLKADPEFQKKIANNDAEAKAKWSKLHKIAYPGEQTLSNSPSAGR
jgi:hypothetical protein